MDGKIGVEDGKETVFGQYVTIGGFKADTSQTNSDNHKLGLWPAGSYNWMAVCGYKNNWPYASMIKEGYWY